jgi:hypothetical protein
MKAIEIIRWAMEMTDEGIERLVADMHDAALTPSTPGAKGGDGNHPLWVLGHLAFIEGMMPSVLFGEPHPLAHWEPLFASGTTPTTDASRYPAFGEVLRTLHDLRARNLKLLDEVGDAGLDRVPKNVPPGFESVMETFGRTFLVIALHQMVHYGQIADARRVAGRKPLF